MSTPASVLSMIEDLEHKVAWRDETIAELRILVKLLLDDIHSIRIASSEAVSRVGWPCERRIP